MVRDSDAEHVEAMAQAMDEFEALLDSIPEWAKAVALWQEANHFESEETIAVVAEKLAAISNDHGTTAAEKNLWLVNQGMLCRTKAASSTDENESACLFKLSILLNIACTS